MFQIPLLPRLAAACLVAALATPTLAAPKVTADIAPVAALADAVLGAPGAATVLLGPGASPHHATLRPSQARDTQEATLIVGIGPDLSPGLWEQIEKLAPTVQHLHLIDAPGLTRLPYAEATEEVATDGHGHAHGQAHGHEHAGEADPHMWLDPMNAIVWLDEIASALSTADPANAATYAANASAEAARLTALTATLQERFAPYQGAQIATSHDDLRYFAARFGLKIAGALIPTDAAPPGAGRVRDLSDTLAEGDIACMALDTAHPSKLARQLARDAGLPVIDTAPLGLPGQSYGQIIDGMAASLLTCLTPES